MPRLAGATGERGWWTRVGSDDEGIGTSMGRMIGYMANRADSLGEVLDREREAVAPPANFRPDAWGIGFFQGGEALHKKRPKLSDGPIDWEKVARGVRSDAIVIHFRQATVGDFRVENAHPFRMRHWLFAHTGTVTGIEAIRPRLLEDLPDFLRRSVRGSTDSELVFHLLLRFLHDAAVIDRPDPDAGDVLAALRKTAGAMDGYCSEVGAPPAELNLILTNERLMFAMRHDAPLCYVERTVSGARDRNSIRYVLVGSSSEHPPSDYALVPERSVLCVDRDLTVTTHPL